MSCQHIADLKVTDALTARLEAAGLEMAESLLTLSLDARAEFLQLCGFKAVAEGLRIAGDLVVVLDHLLRCALRVSGDTHQEGGRSGEADELGEDHLGCSVVEERSVSMVDRLAARNNF